MARRSYGSGSLYLRADGNGAETWFAVRGEQDPPASVLVVAIDDVTLGELQQRFPFSRRLHARLLDRLRQEGARADRLRRAVHRAHQSRGRHTRGRQRSRVPRTP